MADIEEYVEDYEVCTFCGKRIKGVVDWNNNGDPYCQGCIADEEATKTDHAYEMYRDRRDFPEYYEKEIAQRRYGESNIHKN